MKIVIDIPESAYEAYKAWDKNGIASVGETIIAHGTPVQTGEWNNHKVACLLAELFDDACACNYCGIDEWLPQKCDFANKECPNVVGVACWEQFLKHRAKMKGEEE